MLPWANKAKLRFLPACNSQDTGWVKTWCPSSPFPLPLFQPISWKRCISGLAGSQEINAGVPFEASNHEMGLLHLCLTGKWPLNPPMAAFRTQRTVNDNHQSNAFSATSVDTRMRKCARSLEENQEDHPQSHTRGYSMRSHPEVSSGLLPVT